MSAAAKQDLQSLPQMDASDVLKGMHVFLSGWPCVVKDVRVSGTGKHGGTKARITGMCVLTDSKYEIAVPGHTKVHRCHVHRADYQVLFVDAAKRAISILRANDREDELTFAANDAVAQALAQAYDKGEAADFAVTTITVPMPTADDEGATQERIIAWHQMD